jgi:hypothetical protein
MSIEIPAEAIKERTLKEALIVLNEALDSIVYTFPDGRSLNAGPNDIPFLVNKSTQAGKGKKGDYLMADGTVGVFQVKDLDDAIEFGSDELERLNDEYLAIVESQS